MSELEGNCFSLNELAAIADSDDVSILGQVIAEELVARGWDSRQLSLRMGPDRLNEAVVGLLLSVNDEDLLLDDDTARQLGQAFGVSARFFTSIAGGSKLKAKT